MNTAEPIAIVGRGCVLPDCLTPDALWQSIVSNRSLLSLPSESRKRFIQPEGQPNFGIGGYIRHFDDVFKPERYALGAIDVATLDPVVKWPMHAALNAWQEANEPDVASDRVGVVLANLSYPTQGKTDYSCNHWINGRSEKGAINAFNSGLPSRLIALALGAKGASFSLDAACASSLYALEIACRKLQQDSLDVAVVAAVNAAHSDMLQHGFRALQALSPTGRSQPFAASADGLVPAQGAAAVVLKRLRDVSDDEQVFGVIRGIGLSNDGRRGGFLVPDSEGQKEAMHNAYERCDVDPRTIDYLECHATGTPVGDSVEIRSASEFYARDSCLPVGSLKSNTGHLITVAGLASLLKLTLALEHDMLPPTRVDGELNASFKDSCLVPQVQSEPWKKPRTRRAAISNFGFGGNNAHLIFEEYSPASRLDTACRLTPVGEAPTIISSPSVSIDNEPLSERLVICAIGALAGNDRGTDTIARRLMCSPEYVSEHCSSITLDPLTLRTPPADFQHIEAQQLALLAVVDDALQQLDIDALTANPEALSSTLLASSRIGVFAGVGCATDACRWLLRERLDEYFSDCIDPVALETLKDKVVAPMIAADVLGAMPNMPANRINAAFDFRAQGYSVSAEEFSDEMVLQLGCEALNAHDIDLAVIGAADFASETVRSTALHAVAVTDASVQTDEAIRNRFTDKACAMLLMRESTAKALNVTILGCIEHAIDAGCKRRNAPQNNADLSSKPYETLIKRVYGSAPIADTLFSMVVATALASRGQQVVGKITEPRLADAHELRLQFQTSADQFGTHSSIDNVKSVPWTLAFSNAKPAPDFLRPAPCLFYASAETEQQLCQLIKQRSMGGQGSKRIAVVADSLAQLDERLEQALVVLKDSSTAHDAMASSMLSSDNDTRLCEHAQTVERLVKIDGASPGVFTGADTKSGEVAFVYTGSAAAYPRMGRGFLMAFPSLASKLVKQFPSLKGVAHLLSTSSHTAFEQLCAVSLLSQAHTLMLRDVLKLEPDAVLGLSLGETNALFAFGLWDDNSSLLDDDEVVNMYEQQLGGEFLCARDAWGADAPVNWTNWRIYAPVLAVEKAIRGFPYTQITIIYSDNDCTIGGPADECERLVQQLGSVSGVLMSQHLIVHTSTLQPYANTWRQVHTRPTAVSTDVRVYSHGDHTSYYPTRDNIADQLTKQALQTIDFRKIVEKAYADGVRTFVEIGPRDTLTLSVGKILGERPHRAVATDRIEQSDSYQLALVAAALYADGHDLDIGALADQLDLLHHHPWIRRAARSSDINIMTDFDIPQWPPRPQGNSMPCAPGLPAIDHSIVIGLESSEPSTAKSVAMNVPLPLRSPCGPCFEHDALIDASRGLISGLFGESFTSQDDYVRQVRLPAPPLLLVDRIVGIDAKPGVEAPGTIWTETVVKADQWYLHNDAMRPGPLIECGQADLSLISWMGADFRNRDERVYRLLGCEMTVHDKGLPTVGDTLCYQIEITGHAEINGIRLFFFQYDCRVDGRLVISVRHGQAGFFTDAELAASKGVLVELSTEPPVTAEPPVFDISGASGKRSFSCDDLMALRGGDAFACFGEGFEHCAAHTNPPRLPDGKLELFDEVSQFDPAGGAWGRGYLQAVARVPVDAWFYDGHFHNDPCMPGTLMAEAAVQALECLAMAMGLSCQRDGWVFEPLPGASARFECRGQVIPDRQHIVTYDVHVDQIISGDTPEVHAALVASCDGFKVFYCPSFKIRLRRQWPVPSADIQRVLIGPQQESRGDWHALLACGNGAPSEAFGEMYKPMDNHGLAPRLPQPPYHMISRVLSISTRPNQPEVGATVVTEYDVPADAWYFTDGGNGQMPFAVLLEVALQPCGWLGSHGGFALIGGECFRNLDGDGCIEQNVDAIEQSIRVEATMTRFSTMGAMTIVNFDVIVNSSLGHRVMTLETSFGFFPMEALIRQVGLDTNDEQKALREIPAAPCTVNDPHAILPSGQMQMVDEVDFFDPLGGRSGLGLIRGFQKVDPYAWYFKAHFYQDPVQPGSLGLDALLQMMMRAIVLKGLTRDMRKPEIRYITPEQSICWSYRGQVTPSARQVTLVVEIDSVKRRGTDILVIASGSLWRDELRIYEASNLSISVCEADSS